MPKEITIPERFRTFQGEETLESELYVYEGNYFRVDRAMQQMADALKVMSPYSLRRLAEAIDNGLVDGNNSGTVRTEYNDGEFYGRGVEDLGKGYSIEEHFSRFTGCLLGWAGFLEHLDWGTIRLRMGWENTEAVENFVVCIDYGDTPATSAYSARFREMVEWELDRRGLVLTLPVIVSEREVINV